MRKGFIFNQDLCVACRSCSAACMLENSWEISTRSLYRYNIDAFKPDPVINLSMACNHCGDPLCLTGCPASAYRKDPVTGAVEIDSDLCIGCRYCIWNCPYDAPKQNRKSRVIEKCHFCFHRLENDMAPACSSSCPTGALKYDDIPFNIIYEGPDWFPEKGINPSLLITGKSSPVSYDEIPATTSQANMGEQYIKNFSDEWSLVIFTYLISLSAGLTILLPHQDDMIISYLILICTLIAGIFSFFHLGVFTRAWRAVLNIKSSPLSREIALYIMFVILLAINIITELPVLTWGIIGTAFLLLLAVDSIYSWPPGNSYLSLNSGQTFLTGLLIGSFFLYAVIPFIFIGSIKLIINLLKLLKDERGKPVFTLRFVRTALLLIVIIMVLTVNDTIYATGITIFLIGELFDRILFYLDFEPVNINNTIKYYKYVRKTD